ncbi:MAG TPA: hypothetical protein VFG90_08250 [Nitrososphaeraceae archaeon]|nr:hypothetical protein [Nitrososphaeraceae archaeon]
MTSSSREKFVRICDCENGRFITSITRKQIELIYDAMIKTIIIEGDWFKDPVKEMTIQTVSELKEYLVSDANI